MSNSVRPQRWQPTRLPHPWDSPGKNTGVGFHFLLQCMKVKSESEVAQSCRLLATPWTAAYQAPPPMGFSRQEYWSGVPLPSPKNLGFNLNSHHNSMRHMILIFALFGWWNKESRGWQIHYLAHYPDHYPNLTDSNTSVLHHHHLQNDPGNWTLPIQELPFLKSQPIS